MDDKISPLDILKTDRGGVLEDERNAAGSELLHRQGGHSDVERVDFGNVEPKIAVETEAKGTSARCGCFDGVADTCLYAGENK